MIQQKRFSGWVENIMGKGENAGYKHFAGNQHFLYFPQCFLKISFSGWLKVGIVNPFPNDKF